MVSITSLVRRSRNLDLLIGSVRPHRLRRGRLATDLLADDPVEFGGKNFQGAHHKKATTLQHAGEDALPCLTLHLLELSHENLLVTFPHCSQHFA